MALPETETDTERTSPMKRMAYALLPLGLIAGAAFAQTAPMMPSVQDSDGNGSFSLGELQTLWPDLVQDGYNAIDTNLDGMVTQEELQTAWDNGVINLPTSESGDASTSTDGTGDGTSGTTSN